jgi:hypothetical protein
MFVIEFDRNQKVNASLYVAKVKSCMGQPYVSQANCSLYAKKFATRKSAEKFIAEWHNTGAGLDASRVTIVELK